METSMDKIIIIDYSIDGSGNHFNTERIKTIPKAPSLETPKQLQSFIGFVQYYSRFVENILAKAKPSMTFSQDQLNHYNE